jgi:Flp pilus assembly protein protease CpaA
MSQAVETGVARAVPGRPYLGPGAALAIDRRSCWLATSIAPLGAALIWAGLYLVLGDRPPATLAGLVLTVLLATCAVTDLAWHKIPNWATYPAFGWALLLSAVSALVSDPTWSAALGAVGLAECFKGAGACFGIMLFVFWMSGTGAGDVKLATVLGALLGLERGVYALAYTYLAAGLFGLCAAIWESGPLYLAAAVARDIGALILPGWIAPASPEQRRLLRRPVPLGFFFALGTIAALCEAYLPWSQ